MGHNLTVLLYDDIKRAARRAGFDLCGVAPCRVLEQQRPHLEQWLAAGRHGGLDYLRREPGRRVDPSSLVDEARTVIVCAVSYNHGAHLRVEQAAAQGVPKIASYALAPDYHAVLKDMLHRMLGELRTSAGTGFAARGFVDTAPLLEKAWAIEAGLGWRGRNSLLITPDHGSFVVLGEIVTDAPADRYDAPYAGPGCGTCTRCVEACPAGAICEPGVVDAGRCIARLTIEKPENGLHNDPLHGWIFGCDACQSACPHNRRARPGNPALAPVLDPAALTPAFWHSLTPTDFHARMGRTPLARAGLERLQKAVDTCK
ncbi:MAG: tRNA epoxyqueuosine(34) reductase QueG [Rikenellaceae bacterium]|nr:tRNA epoxyqueuosine(34) reductase QueG [Rikenellaceae bacterium]